MLVNGSSLVGMKILSLHVGGPIASVQKIVIDPETLKIIAFEVEGPLVNAETGNMLGAESVREFSRMGLIIDSIDELYAASDVVRIDKIMKLNFNLVGLKVETKKKTKLGKVIDFIVDTEGFKIMQLVVHRQAIKSFLDPELVVGRSQIVEVTDYKIIVKDEEAKIRKETVEKDFVPNFVNPFREGRFAMSQNQNPEQQDIE